MKRRKLVGMIVVVAVWNWPAMAADLDLPRAKAAPVAAPVSATTVNVFGPPDAACTEWSDGCRVCIKSPSGEAICSNPGIACTPRTVTCSRR
jgi:hypothetical protein